MSAEMLEHPMRSGCAKIGKSAVAQYTEYENPSSKIQQKGNPRNVLHNGLQCKLVTKYRFAPST